MSCNIPWRSKSFYLLICISSNGFFVLPRLKKKYLYSITGFLTLKDMASFVKTDSCYAFTLHIIYRALMCVHSVSKFNCLKVHSNYICFKLLDFATLLVQSWHLIVDENIIYCYNITLFKYRTKVVR